MISLSQTNQRVEQYDSWPYFQRDPVEYKKTMSQFYYFMIEGFAKPFGYAHSDFVEAMPWPNGWAVKHEQRFLILQSPRDFHQRTKLMNDTLRTEHERGEIDALKYWSGELFPVYAADGEHVLDMDGC